MVNGMWESNREQLERERARLIGELNRFLQRDVNAEEVFGYRTHLAEDATDVFEQTKDLSMKQTLEHLLEEINAALKRIEEGRYGKCESCGVDISPERLEAIPYARRCITCQQKLQAR